MSTKTMDPAAVVAALEWRYAVKKFAEGKAIPAETWQALERSLVLAPSSFGLQPWRFVVVTDPAVKARLKPASWNQNQLVEASLASESGKIYVMLAEAAGRIPPQ